MAIWARMKNWRGCVSDGGKNCYMWTKTDDVSQPNLLRGPPLCQGSQGESTSGSTTSKSLSLDYNGVVLWCNGWVSFHEGWTPLLSAIGYASLQALFCMTTWVLSFRLSDIDIISISVQRFSEVLPVGTTMGGSHGQSIFDSSARTCWEGVGVNFRALLIQKHDCHKASVQYVVFSGTDMHAYGLMKFSKK